MKIPRPESKIPGLAPLHLMRWSRDRTSRNATITTRVTGNYRGGDYHCYVRQLLHHRAS